MKKYNKNNYNKLKAMYKMYQLNILWLQKQKQKEKEME